MLIVCSLFLSKCYNYLNVGGFRGSILLVVNLGSEVLNEKFDNKKINSIKRNNGSY